MNLACDRCQYEYPPDYAASCPVCGFHPDRDPKRFGPYQLMEILGRGALGIVFKAQREGNVSVALKILSTTRPELVRQFDREGLVAARLKHPSIVGIRDAGDAEGRRYLAFEFVPGKSLAALIRERQIDPAGVARIGDAIARALLHAHRKGIIHRDITPGNILVAPDGAPKITDFGLAIIQEPDSRHEAGVTAGTPVYMSPEQASGMHDVVGARSDIYSLGAVLYEALSGRAPFTGTSTQEVLRKVREEEPPPLSGTDPRLEAVVTKAMAKDPLKRHQTMKELADELRRAVKA